MVVAGDLRKRGHKLLILSIKVIPILIAICDMINTVFWTLGIDTTILSFISGISVFTIILLYLMSYVLHFCAFHRMFIHYILLNNIVSSLDYFDVLPIAPQTYFIIIGIFLILLLIIHQKEKRDVKRTEKCIA